MLRNPDKQKYFDPDWHYHDKLGQHGRCGTEASAVRESMKIRLVPDKFRYRRNLPHFQKADRSHFVTFDCVPGLKLPPEARDIVFDACHYLDGRKIELSAVVVMPEHVHMIAMPMRDANGELILMREIMNSLKGYTAHAINKLLRRKGQVWQDESFDHVLRSDESLDAKIEYIRQNPVKRKLVRESEDYKWLWTVKKLSEIE